MVVGYLLFFLPTSFFGAAASMRGTDFEDARDLLRFQERVDIICLSLSLSSPLPISLSLFPLFLSPFHSQYMKVQA
jgi:hypothetical protein